MAIRIKVLKTKNKSVRPFVKDSARMRNKFKNIDMLTVNPS